MRRTSVLLLVLTACSIWAEESPLCLELPREATKEQAAKCSDALQKRCKAYGFDGVTGAVVESGALLRVELTCKTGFSDAMRQTVTKLARLPAQKVELRFVREMTPAEREQFVPGPWEDPSKDKAPKDAVWTRMIDEDFRDAPAVVTLLRYSPVVSLKELGALVQPEPDKWNPDPRPTYVLSKETTKRIQNAFTPPKKSDDLMTPNTFDPSVWVALVIDGKAVDVRGSLRLPIWDNGGGAEVKLAQATLEVAKDWSRTFEAVVRFPMPFGLTVVK
jgi:hypothetical protein